jgi:hypothetical protein
MRHTREMHAYEVPVHEMHAHKVQAGETHTREMHSREMYTREIYAHRSMAFLGVWRCGCCKRVPPEPRYLHSPATMTSTRFIKHNKRP